MGEIFLLHVFHHVMIENTAVNVFKAATLDKNIFLRRLATQEIGLTSVEADRRFALQVTESIATPNVAW